MRRLLYEIIGRLTILAACVAFIGLPMVSLPAAVLFLCLIALTIFSDWRLATGKMRGWLALAILLGAIAKFIPQIEIQEGHNLLLPIGDTEAALHQALPPSIYQYAQTLFDDAYPPSKWCDPTTTPGCWHQWGSIKRPFAFSADGAFQHPLYSRVVHGIDFDDVRSFRGGFLNSRSNWGDLYRLGDLDTPWWDENATSADPIRSQMPFFVVYELPPSVDGLPLCWSGDIFFEDANGNLEHALSRLTSCRTLQEGNPTRLYGLSINPRYPLSIHMRPRLTLPDVAQRVRDIYTLLAAIATVFMFLAPRWKPVLGIAISAGFVFLLGQIAPYWQLGGAKLYRGLIDPLFGGDGDELIHWGYGRIILEQAVAGHWYEVLRGAESVYFLMPGYRYFHAAEMALFGERGMLSLMALAIYPYCVYALSRRLMDDRIALLVTGLYFLLMTPYCTPMTGWNEDGALGMIVGLAESIAYPCALVALVLALDATGLPYHDASPKLFSSALLLACATVIRPNLIAADIMFLYLLWWLHRREAPLKTALWLAVGWLPVFSSLAHNLCFGSSAVLFANGIYLMVDGKPFDLPAPPYMYLKAFDALITGVWNDTSLAIVRQQVSAVVRGEGGAVFILLGGVIAVSSGFLLRLNVAEFWRRLRSGVKIDHLMIAVYISGLYAVLLCTLPAGRYALLAGNLTFVLMGALCASVWERHNHTQST